MSLKKDEVKTIKKAMSDQAGYYELILFAFFMFEFAVLAHNKVVDVGAQTAYLLTYEFGFASKALIGSILSLFTDKITSHMILTGAVVSFIILAVFMSVLLGRLIRTSLPETHNTVVLFVFLFISSPLSVTYLLGMFIGRYDTYLMLITLSALICLKRPVWKWFVPLFFILAVMIHQGYIISYLPALAIPVLFEIANSRYSKTHIAIFIVSCLSVAVLVAVFVLIPPNIPFENANDFAVYLSARSDFPVSRFLLQENFPPFRRVLEEYIFPFSESYAIPLTSAMIAYTLPLIAVFTVLWVKAFRSAENKLLKFVFMICIFAPLTFVPAAVMANDWSRYWAAAVNTQFTLVFYFLISKQSSVMQSAKRISDFFARHFLLLLTIIIFTSAIKFSQAVTNMFCFIKDPDAITDLLKDVLSSNLF